MPRVDVSESDNEYEVTAELPGIDEKHVEVTLAIICSPSAVREVQAGREVRRQELLSERAELRLVPARRAAARGDRRGQGGSNFKNGVMSVRLPKSPQAQAKTRRIEVQGA